MSLNTNTHLCHAPHALNDDKVPIGEIWRPVVPVNQRFDFKTNRNRPQTYCLFSMFFPPHIRCQVGHHIAEWIEGAQRQLKNEISIRHQTTQSIIILYPKWDDQKLTVIRNPPKRANIPLQGRVRILDNAPSISLLDDIIWKNEMNWKRIGGIYESALNPIFQSPM